MYAYSHEVWFAAFCAYLLLVGVWTHLVTGAMAYALVLGHLRQPRWQKAWKPVRDRVWAATFGLSFGPLALVAVMKSFEGWGPRL